MIRTVNNAMTQRRAELKNGENDKGFTLIELMVVIIIIGILAAIAIPVFLNQRQQAWDASVSRTSPTLRSPLSPICRSQWRLLRGLYRHRPGELSDTRQSEPTTVSVVTAGHGRDALHAHWHTMTTSPE